MPFYRVIGTVLRPIWRARRGLTLGAVGCVIDERDKVLLVKHSYRAGWHFPGGGVEWGETTEAAMRRELAEEVGVEVIGDADLHGVFTNFKSFPGDHIAFYIVRRWRRPVVPGPNAEIIASGFYHADELPEGTSGGVRRRLAEVFGDAAKSASW